jgi:hypothetical protein
MVVKNRCQRFTTEVQRAQVFLMCVFQCRGVKWKLFVLKFRTAYQYLLGFFTFLGYFIYQGYFMGAQ